MRTVPIQKPVATDGGLDVREKLRRLMCPGQPRLAAFFSYDPVTLGLILGIGSFLVLMLPALIAHVALIKDLETPKWPWVGFWQRWNWAGMYVLILPLIFAGAAALSQTSLRIFDCLTTGKFSVVKTSDGSPAVNFVDAITIHASKLATLVFWTAVVLTIILTVVDTHELAVGLYQSLRHRPHTFSDLDWSVAFDLSSRRFSFYGFHQRGVVANLFFDVFAYAAQTTAIFLGLFWIMMYWATLNAFSTQLVDKENDFHFDPWWDDPTNRMGLFEVGKLFNGFLAIAALFELYVLGHRFQLIARAGRPLVPYAKEIWAKPTDIQVLWSQRAFDTCTPGMWLLLIFVLLPIVVIAWVPLIRFRHYLNTVTKNKFEALREELNTYKFGTTERKAALDLWYKIKRANIWPNGDFVGWSFLVLMFVLAGAGWFPPFLGYLLAGGGLALLYKFLGRFVRKGSNPSESE
jgi:hypothetical protein